MYIVILISVNTIVAPYASYIGVGGMSRKALNPPPLAGVSEIMSKVCTKLEGFPFLTLPPSPHVVQTQLPQ